MYHLWGQLASGYSEFPNNSPAVIFIPIFKEDDAMKIEKLPSGSYRVRKMYKGQVYTVIFDGKPTQKEAIKAISDEMGKIKSLHESMTFQVAAEKYIESKRNVLSPSTIRGYDTIIRQLSKTIMQKNIHDITNIDVQTEINRISKKCSPKTTRNYHGFISAVLKTFCPGLNLNTTLPQKVKSNPYIPSGEDIRRILKFAKGTQYEIPIILACYGLRRSEICALTLDDIDGDIVRINKAKVQNEKKEWIIKTTKTTASTREVTIPMDIVDKIRTQGYIYKGYPNSITCYLNKMQDILEIPHFSIHKLRHYFASEMSALGVPEADILKMGGWETDHVMKSVYRHSMMEKEENAKREATEKLRNVILS